jgi:hypothetical protein
MAKIRSTKSETRNKSEIPNPLIIKTACPTDNPLGRRAVAATAKKIGGQMPTLRFYRVLDFDFRSFDIVSYLDIRISDLTPYKQLASSQHSGALVAL